MVEPGQNWAHAGQAGCEVGCDVIAMIFREAERLAIPAEKLTRDTGYSAAQLSERERRIDWDDFRQLMQNAAAIWSKEELYRIGVSFADFRLRRPFSLISRFFLDPIDLYLWVSESSTHGTHRHFHCLRDEVVDHGGNQIVITTRVLDGYEPCRPLEHVIQGARAALPVLVGLDHALVELTQIENGARYDIRLQRNGRSNPLRRFLVAPFLALESGRTLRRAHRDLDDRTRKIDEGNRKLVSEISDRQHVELALRASEDRFKVLVESAHDLIVEVDDQGRCVYASPNHFEQLGLRPADMVGKLASERIHPDDLAELMDTAQHEPALTGRNRSTYRYRHADGEWIWLESSSSVYTGVDGRQCLVSIARDISERLRLEERARALDAREQEERYELLEGKLALETMIADLSRRFLDLPSEEVSNEVERGLASVGELVDTERAYLFTMDIANSRLEGLYEWFAPEVETETWLPDRIKKWRDTGATEGPTYAWSARRAARGEVVHAPRVVDLPDQAESERADLLARGVRSYLNIPLRSGRDYLGFLGLETMSVEKTWSEDTIALLELVGQIFLSALRRERAEEALRESQRQLIQSQKMEALGRLAGGIAHDFNNMLMVIGGCAEALLHDSEPEGESEQDLLEIQSAARRAGSLTQQLLAFSRRQPYLPTPLDLNEVVEGLRSMLVRVIGEDIELASMVDGDLGTILGDSAQIEQLLVNLAVNARDAMPGGGKLTVYTRSREFNAQEASERDLPKPGEYVELGVQDTGVGIEESQRSLIFEPFFTTKEVGRGTGLGLSIVYGIVQQNAGGIQVQSEVGEGTTIRIWFPVQGRAEEERQTQQPQLRADVGATILLVEDEDAVRRLVRRVLEGPGYTILEASNGIEGLQIGNGEQGGDIDLVVSDLVMPGKGGVDMATELREAHPGLPVLFISGYADERIEDLATRIPGAGILCKPFDADLLLAEVRDQLNAGARDGASK